MDLDPKASIFSAEAEAIVEALKLEALQENKNVLIISDSRSVLMAVHSYPKSNTHALILTIKSHIQELQASGFNVKLLWVPSHMGIEGNDRADKIAATFETESSYSQAMYSRDLKAFDKASQISKWQNEWNLNSMGRTLHHIQPRVNAKPWFSGMSLPRQVVSTINRLKCGHTKLKDHLNRLQLAPDNLCSCGVPQTINHLLFMCNDIDQTQRSALYKTFRSEGHLPSGIDTLLKSNNKKIFLALYTFFKSIGINI